MLIFTLINLFVSLLMFVGSVVILLRISSWRTLLMVAGAILALTARTTSVAVGLLETANVVTITTYQKFQSITSVLSTTGNLISAAGFLALAIYLFRRFPPIAKKDSVAL